ncbi:tetratricopeptide repeat protein [Pararobbsia alpina]|uniref:Beta-barrel assembly-enhancing protease n=1 Tax=Pararobbsia alpina TaxID=621374 RepID=A0A6S7BUU5_9BURK|nr:tetratricopeptide repeat protein [Pararobbsia alpina]CAB3799953.1 Beta-barrel assembly-enhancing protease [Pararobbsia alpina]
MSEEQAEPVNRDAPTARAQAGHQNDHGATLQQAVSLHMQGRFAEAAALYQRFLDQEPRHGEVIELLGISQLADGDAQSAAGQFRQSIEIDPKRASLHANLGRALMALGRHEEAIASIDRALAATPDDVEAWINRGNSLGELERVAESLACFDAALRLKPDHAGALNNRGEALRKLERYDEALLCFDRVLALDPEFVLAGINRGNVLAILRRHDEALAAVKDVLAIAPDSTMAQWNSSLLNLLFGHFPAGWRAYEARWSMPGFESRRHTHLPVWLGATDLRGKRVLLWHEQGLGDTLQFCRYAVMVAALGALVVCEVQPSLKSLLATSLRNIAVVVATGDPVPPCDCATPLMSLPFAFGTDSGSIPYAPAYLAAEPARVAVWKQRLGPRRHPLRIGLTLSGNPAHKRDRTRSLDAVRVEPLAGMADCFIVQKERRETDASTFSRLPDMRYVGDELGDFGDTAALIANLDLVISVDTSIAHLAAAMGKPVWLLLAFDPDWRWQMERQDSPWYPTMRLFRQSEAGDWDEVIGRVAHALAELSSLHTTLRSG